MGKAKKKFIDPKRDKVHTFKLVHRSQQDPLAADADAPQRVLAEITPREKRQNALHECGLYVDPDDEYDYLQHIRDPETKNKPFNDMEVEEFTIMKDGAERDRKFVLPSEVLGSKEQEEIGLLNRGVDLNGLPIDLDPDIMAELDKAEGEEVENCTENELDEILGKLDAEDSPDDPSPEMEHDSIYPYNMYGYKAPTATDNDPYKRMMEAMDGSEDDWSMSDNSDEDMASFVGIKEKKANTDGLSQISRYTVTTNRPEHMQLTDRKFEHLMNTTYAENIDQMKITEGTVDPTSDYFRQLITPVTNKDKEKKDAELRKSAIDFIKQRMALNNGDSDLPDEYEEIKLNVKTTKSETIDDEKPSQKRPRCEPSVLNLPFARKKSKLNLKALNKQNNDEYSEYRPDDETKTILTTLSAVSVRTKGESTAERRERKGAIKELRSERRVMKKTNKELYKEQNKMANQILTNQSNTPTIKFI